MSIRNAKPSRTDFEILIASAIGGAILVGIATSWAWWGLGTGAVCGTLGGTVGCILLRYRANAHDA